MNVCLKFLVLISAFISITFPLIARAEETKVSVPVRLGREPIFPLDGQPVVFLSTGSVKRDGKEIILPDFRFGVVALLEFCGEQKPNCIRVNASELRVDCSSGNTSSFPIRGSLLNTIGTSEIPVGIHLSERQAGYIGPASGVSKAIAEFRQKPFSTRAMITLELPDTANIFQLEFFPEASEIVKTCATLQH